MSKRLLPVNKLFPNIVTLIGMCCGLTSVKYTFMGMWELAIIFILIASVFDWMDGIIARFLSATSNFGAQLDTLSDLISFGVAPAILLYFWTLSDIKIFGWVLVMLFVICIALRLARFNNSLNSSEIGNVYFVGIPAPAGAILVLMPLIISLNSDLLFIQQWSTKFNLSMYVLVISFLVISRIPTFSLKKVNIPARFVSLAMLFFGLLIVLIIAYPWFTLPLIAVIYILSIPVSIGMYLCYPYKNNSQQSFDNGD